MINILPEASQIVEFDVMSIIFVVIILVAFIVGVVKGLIDIDYKGYFTLECNTHIARGGFTPDNVKWGVRDLADKVRGLANEFERLAGERR